MRGADLSVNHHIDHSADGFRLALSLLFAAIIALVSIVEVPIVWWLSAPVLIALIVVAVKYQRALDWTHGDSRSVWLGVFLAIPAVGSLLVRGTEAAVYAGPALSIVGGIMAWMALRWVERGSSSRGITSSNAA